MIDGIGVGYSWGSCLLNFKNKMEIPKFKLNNGIYIPCVGNGPGIIGYTPKPKKRTFIKKVYDKVIGRSLLTNKYINAVANSFEIGYALLDNSASYHNNKAIKSAIIKSGVDRKDLFITTRISNQAQFTHKVREEFFKGLKELGIEQYDLLQFHWPVTNFYLETWDEMVKLYKEGYVRSIGVANCHKHHLEAIIKSKDIIPAIDQFEVHPLFTQKPLISYCKSMGIQVQAYSAIARFDDRLMRLPLLKKIAKKYNKSVVQIILRWDIQNQIIPIIRSLNKERQLENISIFDFNLTPEEIQAIDSININARVRYDPDNCDFTVL